MLVILLTVRVFAERVRVTGVFSYEVYAGMVIVIALTTLIPLFVIKRAYERCGEAIPVG